MSKRSSARSHPFGPALLEVAGWSSSFIGRGFNTQPDIESWAQRRQPENIPQPVTDFF